jgi:hypothetical protein
MDLRSSSFFRYLEQFIQTMELPKGIIDFLFYLAPSLLVFFTAWILIKKFLEREQRIKLIETKMAMQKDLLPLRLQAYERLTIYLERVSPNVLLLNQYEAGKTVQEFQSALIETLRTEFEHNFSQQIYVSEAIWTIIRNAKEEVARIINTSAAGLDAEAPAYQLSKAVFDTMLERQEFPTQKALSILKSEVSQLFG